MIRDLSPPPLSQFCFCPLYTLLFQIIFLFENSSVADYNLNLLVFKHIIAFWHDVMFQFYFVHSLS